VPSSCWSIGELSSALTCACLPTLRPLLSRHFPSLGSRAGTSGSSKGYLDRSKESSGSRHGDKSKSREVESKLREPKSPPLHATESDLELGLARSASKTSNPFESSAYRQSGEESICHDRDGESTRNRQPVEVGATVRANCMPAQPDGVYDGGGWRGVKKDEGC